MTTVEVHEASFETMAACSTISILGKRRTGKTTWATYIAQFISSVIFIVMCGNKDNISEWRQIVAPLYVQNKCLDYLKRIRDFQDNRCSQFSKKQLEIPDSHRITLVFDDCGYDKQFMHSDIMKDILSNGRHYGMYILILCQYLNQMHAVNRDQLDYIGVLYTSNVTNIKKVYNEYMNVCDFRTFKAILQGTTSNRGMCWIDNTRPTNKVHECAYFAHIPPSFTKKRLGCSSTWDFSARRHMNDRNEQKLKNFFSSSNATHFNTDEEEEGGGDELYQNVVIPDQRGDITIRKLKLKLE
jgi:hypothetical protein